jgi:hypothetical protein
MATRDPQKKLTGLDDGPKTRVFNTLVAYLMRDAVLSRIFRPNSWFTWEGRTMSDASEIVLAQMPAIRITPAARDPQWSDPRSQKGMLTFDLELWTAGCCCDDVSNLWDAVEQAIYTPLDLDASRAFETSLREAGAITGQVSVLMCAMMPYNPGPGPNPPVIGMYARGQLGVDVRINS